jgi:hypothetical protein
MLPTISLKQLLCSRAICSAIIDRVVVESVDSGMTTTVSDVVQAGPVEAIYVGMAMYYAYTYLANQPSKKAKFEKLNQYILSENVYRTINIALFILFMIFKSPSNAI